MSTQIALLLTVAIAVAMPVLWAGLGELISERAGMINPGIEGVILISALTTTIAYHKTGSGAAAMLAAIAVGVLCGIFFAYLFIYRSVNQIIAGILFNLFAFGITTTVFISDSALARSRVATLPKVKIPLLSDIPIIGTVLFNQTALVYISIVAVAVVGFLMGNTWLGLSIRAAGEHPRAVESSGVNVWRVRAVAAVLGSVFPAVGGAVLILGTVGGFSVGMSAGQGFVALGIVVLARWNSWGVLAGSLLFGLAQSLQYQAQNFPGLEAVPNEIWLATPYIVTILAVMFTRSSDYPKAAATPYAPPKRHWHLLLVEAVRGRKTKPSI